MRLVSLLVLLATLAPAALAQTAPLPGSCVLGTAQADLSANNALARVFNTGSLFYGNSAVSFYYVPQASRKSPIYASGIWIGGKVGGQLRVAGGTYGPSPGMDFTFWPGPLGSNGRPVNPTSCAAFDRIYSVSQSDIAAYRNGSGATADLAGWPVQLGAPYFVDTNRNGTRDPNEPRVVRRAGDPGYGVGGTSIDLAGGQTPDIVGTQGLWWVMNDVGNVHPAQNTPPLGVEVQVLAFSFARPDALGDATFYRYTIVNKSGAPITDAYVSVFSDPDLGDASDDYVGSDPAAGLGYVYNADNVDGTGGGTTYGTPPPALGYDFFQGPIVPDGPDAGTQPDTLGATAFSYFRNSPTPAGNPDNGEQIYNFQQGLWGDGSTMRAFGNGYQQTQGAITRFAFPGDPLTGQGWTASSPSSPEGPADLRFALHTGPFRLNAGEAQDVIFGIIFGQGTSNLNSVTALRAADALAQTTFDNSFTPPPVAGEDSPGDAAEVLHAAPNPFADLTRVDVGAQGESVRAVLFDVIGREVAVVHDGPLSGALEVSGAHLVPGVYVLRVQTGSAERSVRLVRR